MIETRQVRQAINMLLRAAPGSRVILFGSWARGTAQADSDLDFLVVEPTVTNPRAEMVRLRQVLRPLRVPADVLVVSERTFQEWRDTPNTVIHVAATEGRVHEQVA